MMGRSKDSVQKPAGQHSWGSWNPPGDICSSEAKGGQAFLNPISTARLRSILSLSQHYTTSGHLQHPQTQQARHTEAKPMQMFA
ncbi:hypothetical protein PO909_033046 [Leuciscus waleckii]